MLDEDIIGFIFVIDYEIILSHVSHGKPFVKLYFGSQTLYLVFFILVFSLRGNAGFRLIKKDR